MSNKNLSIGLVVVAVIAIIGLFLPRSVIRSVTQAVNSITTNLPSLGVNSLAIGAGCDQSYTSTLCAGTGQTSLGNFEMNGIVSTSSRLTMTTATSTPCAFQVGAATSSLVFFDAVVSSSTAVTATTYTLATSTSFNATSSPFWYFPTGTTTLAVPTLLSANTQATTTVAAGAQASLLYYAGEAGSLGTVLAPNVWVVLGVQGGTGTFGTAAQVGGSCQGQFIIL